MIFEFYLSCYCLPVQAFPERYVPNCCSNRTANIWKKFSQAAHCLSRAVFGQEKQTNLMYLQASIQILSIIWIKMQVLAWDYLTLPFDRTAHPCDLVFRPLT